MNIVYSSDENYVQHMAVSIESLLENNKETDEIVIYVLSNDISRQSQSLLEELVFPFNRVIYFIDFAPFKEQLKLNMEWEISLSSYARLFLPEMLPEDCKKVLYLDCDTVVCDSLDAFWNTDLQGKTVGAVIDTVSSQFKNAVGLKENDVYVNAGVLLVDLEKWRLKNVQAKLLKFIESYEGRVSHHDQGTINGVLHDDIVYLHPKYNAMTPVFTTRYKNLYSLYKIKGKYYSKRELLEAKKSPVIIHYVPEFVGRVWEYECQHPKKDLYREYLSKTAWKDNLKHAKNVESRKMQCIYWIYCKGPVWLQKILFR